MPTLTASPHILAVYGPEGLEEDVRKEELDCILFLSAPFCRTCRKLQGPYSRLARLNAEDEESEVVFAKAEIVGTFGKALGKELAVDSVPAFVLFRQGERFGKVLSISKLPNPQLDMALQFLKDSQEWDDSQFDTSTNRPGTKI
jgi:thiol-disulfide isomerase/thioredoxin